VQCAVHAARIVPDAEKAKPGIVRCDANRRMSTSRTSRAATRHPRPAILLQVAAQPVAGLLFSESFQKVGALSDQRAPPADP
jgi:hypothetical protein